MDGIEFESFVNSERCKTYVQILPCQVEFESFVNSERCKTSVIVYIETRSLRALLIQKDVKQYSRNRNTMASLRALLIQKDVKLTSNNTRTRPSLRALLIQKDVKRSVLLAYK